MSFWKPGTPQAPVAKAPAKAATVEKISTSSVVKPKLSKGVMGMKFMKQKETTGDTQIIKSTALENFERSTNSKLECFTEHFDFVAALPGRRSFNGCNKAVERHYEQVLDDLKYKRKITATKSDTISDEDMLKRYESLIGLPRGPSQGKRPDNRSINKAEIGNGNKRSHEGNSKDKASKKGKMR